MPNSERLSRRVFRPDFSWVQARDDLPRILNSLPEPHRHPAVFISIAGRHASEALSLTLTQYTKISRPPLQSNEFEHLFRPLAYSFEKLTQAEASFASKYLTVVRPNVVREVRKQGRSPCDHLFLSNDGEPINQDSFRKAFRRAGRAITSQPFSPRVIRGLSLRAMLARLASTDRELIGVPWLKKSHLIEIERLRLLARLQDQASTWLPTQVIEEASLTPDAQLEKQ
ncbi:hypothetical protein ACC676_08835 [Rhizobium ruizarguesonis]